ncbi:MAG: HEAT repeat domain-containing protein [Chlamydiota bacterium]
MEKQPFKDILNEFNTQDREETPIPEDLPLADAIDHQIVMHRDAHFGGKFEFMLDYYRQEGKGVNEEFEIDRIENLAEVEKELDSDIAGSILLGYEAEEVAKARQAYKKLREVYESKSAEQTPAKLISDLILSEDEYPEKEIQAIVDKGQGALPLLINLLNSEDFYNNLFPGYGLAPALAAECLGAIGDSHAIEPLFRALKKGDFFIEDNCLQALKKIGEPAKEFLLRQLSSQPLTEDNELAAVALVEFKDDPEVIKNCKKLWQTINPAEEVTLANYLQLIINT